MKYPIPISDTGALSDTLNPQTWIDKAKNQPVLAGTVVGGVAGYFIAKRPIIGAAFGWLLGMSGLFGKGQ